MSQLECLLDEQHLTITMHYRNECIMCNRSLSTVLHKDSPWSWVKNHRSLRCIPHSIGHCDACHTNYTNPSLGWLPWLGITVVVPIKADLQAHACLSEYHDDDHSLMLIKDARSDGYALGTLSSEEWARPMEVGSRNQQSLSLLFMTNDKGNCIAI